MGTRDRVLGDAALIHPMEQRGLSKVSEDTDVSSMMSNPTGIAGEDEGADLRDPQKYHLMDINQYRFNGRLQNYLHSTCPIIPKFHATYGQPIERQEISQDLDNGRDTDRQKQESRKLIGRIDSIYKHEDSQLNLVMDDFGIHVLYDAAFVDMRSIE